MATVTRLSSPAAFRSVFTTGRSYAQGSVVMYVAKRATGGGPPRAGFVVSRKVGGAVARNRAKPLLRDFAPATGGEPRLAEGSATHLDGTRTARRHPWVSTMGQPRVGAAMSFLSLVFRVR